MEDQVLSIEQMQELSSLGIDTSKASMCWYQERIDEESRWMLEQNLFNPEWIKKHPNKYVPTFTLQDILSILPEEIQNHKLKSDLKGYIHYVFRGSKIVHNLIAIECETMLEAAFNMLKWCKQNNII